MAAGVCFSVRQQLLSRWAEARRCTDELFRIVRAEAIYGRPIAERHRIIFYIGHLEAFDWNLVGKRVLGLPVFDAPLDKLFAFGIDPVDGKLPSDTPSDWPSRDTVSNYVRRVRETLDAAVACAPFDDPARPLLRDGYVLHVAIEHRWMHAETLAYMFHRLPLEKKIAPRPSSHVTDAAVGGTRWVARLMNGRGTDRATHRVAPTAGDAAGEMAPIPAGTATLGLPRHGAFGWDNEFEQHTAHVPAFSITKHKVTNGHYLKFVREGGYRERSLWSDDAWEWKERAGITHPQFWVRRGEEWFQRTMFDEVPLPLAWPVYVSHAEAAAYARWAGKALPTEAQFHRAAYGTPAGIEREFPWGNEPPEARHGNFDFASWDPADVNAHPAGHSAFGVHGLVGNGWEWTSTVFAPFPGFERFSFYPGYSADFFDDQHFVMKGGSALTAACLLRRTFRNWFQPHYPHIYTGFRCVEPGEAA